jgi:hypothetical protein
LYFYSHLTAEADAWSEGDAYISLSINATGRSKNWQAGKLIVYIFLKAVVYIANHLFLRGVMRILSGSIRVVYDLSFAK